MIPILFITAFVLPAIVLVTAYMIYDWPEPTVRERYIRHANYLATEVFQWLVVAVLSIIGCAALSSLLLYLSGRPQSASELPESIEITTYLVAPVFVYLIAKIDLDKADAPPS